MTDTLRPHSTTPDSLVQIGDSGIPSLDWVDTTGLKRDRNSGEPGIDFHYLPKPPEERGFDRVTAALGLTDEEIPKLPRDDRTYYSVLSTAVGSCIIPGPNGEISELELDQVTHLHELAQSMPDDYGDLMFLQAFTARAREERRALLSNGGMQDTHASADAFYAHVMTCGAAVDSNNVMDAFLLD